MKTHNDVRSRRHQLSRIPRTVVIKVCAGQVTKIEVLPQSWAALSELHLGAAHLPRGDDLPRQLCESAVAGRRIAPLISRYLYPFVAVVHRGGLMFLEAETNVMHHGQVARQNFHRRDPRVALEGSRHSE